MREKAVYSDYVTVAKPRFFNHDSIELILRPKIQQLLVMPVGYHLSFLLTVLGRNLIRFTASAGKLSRIFISI